MQLARVARFFTCLFCLGAIICLVGAFWTYVRHQELNLCDMTYMYQYPQYVPIRMSDSDRQQFPRYNLYAYAEGAQMVEKFKQSPLPNGIPVLFIPGHAGSHKQVRSIASIALRKSLDYPDLTRAPDFHYFSIDFDEELSGIYGGVLERQTAFAASCMFRIIQMYAASPHRPRHVILIGHSMGGLIAKGIYERERFTPDFILIIITLSTPHLAPVVYFDWDLTEFYGIVNGYWNEYRTSSLRNSTLISIVGGPRDILVRSSLGGLDYTYNNPDRSFFVATTAISRVWVSADHLCIVWCNQVARFINRMLFDMYDPQTGQITDDLKKRLRIIKYHTMENRGFANIDSLNNGTVEEVAFENVRDVRHLNTSDVQLIYTSPRASTVMYKKFVSADLLGSSAFVLTNQQGLDYFLYKCNTDVGCKLATPYTNVRMIPPNNRITSVDFTASMQGETVMVTTAHHSPRKLLLYKLYPSYRHQATIVVGSAFYWNFEWEVDGDVTVYNITLSEFSSYFYAFTAALIPLNCTRFTDESLAALHFHVPQNPAQDLYRAFRYPYNESDNLILHLQMPMAGFGKTHDEWPILQMYMNPGCHYKLTIKSNILQSFAHCFHHYSPLFPALIVTQLIGQLLAVFLLRARTLGRAFVGQLLAAFYCGMCIEFKFFGPNADWVSIFAMLFLTIGVVSLGHIVVFILCFVLHGFLNLTSRKPQSSHTAAASTDLSFILLCIKPFILCASLLAFGFAFCGIIMSYTLLIYHFMLIRKHCTQAYFVSRDTILLHMHLWLCVTVVPSGLVWFKGLKYGSLSLGTDPSFIVGVALVVCTFVPLPSVCRKFRHFSLVVFVITTNVQQQWTYLAITMAVIVGLYINWFLEYHEGLFVVFDRMDQPPERPGPPTGRSKKVS